MSLSTPKKAAVKKKRPINPLVKHLIIWPLWLLGVAFWGYLDKNFDFTFGYSGIGLDRETASILGMASGILNVVVMASLFFWPALIFKVLRAWKEGNIEKNSKRASLSSPIVGALKGFFGALIFSLGLIGYGTWMGFDTPTFYQSMGVVAAICPFIFAAKEWYKAVEYNEKSCGRLPATSNPVDFSEQTRRKDCSQTTRIQMNQNLDDFEAIHPKKIDLEKVGGIPGSARVPIEGGSMRVSMAPEIDLTSGSRKLDQTLILGEILNKVMEMEDGPGKDEFLLVLNKHLDDPVKLEH